MLREQLEKFHSGQLFYYQECLPRHGDADFSVDWWRKPSRIAPVAEL